MSYIKQDESGGGGDTYTLKAAQSGADVDIQLDAAAGTDSDVKLKAGTNITLTEASDTITIDAASGGSPGGSNTQVQFNDGGSFGGDDAFTYDKTNDRVKIGNATIEADNTAKLHVVGTDAGLTVERHDDGSSAGPTLNLFRHSDSPADGDDIGQVNFRGEADNGDNITYASIKAEIEDVTTASKDGKLTLRTITNSTQTDAIIIDTKINSEIDHNFKGLIQVNGAAGTAGQVLTSQGSGSDPIWAAAGGGSSFPQFATTPVGGYYIPFCLPPLSFNILSFSTTTISNDLLFAPVLFTNDTTISEMGTRYGSGTLNPFSMCIYESDSNNLPDTKLSGSEIAFASPGSSFNIATLTSPLTLSANTFYWVGFTNTTNGSNVSLTAVASAGSPVTTNGSDFNKSSVVIYTGTINSLPATVTTSDLVTLYAAPYVFFK
mgnify:CR=1 FL=1|jgi:hypothetical protein